MELGERIRWLRKLQGMTIETLAGKVGVTRQTISRYETGAIIDIPKSKLESVAAALDVSVDYLNGWTLESQRDSIQYDLQKQKEMLQAAKNEDEKMAIELNVSILEESYEDLRIALQLQSASIFSNQKQQRTNGFTIGSKVREWHSDKKANLTMAIDSWLLLALKGMAADSNRSLADEIESALYDYVMNAIDAESNAPKEE